MPNFKVEVTKVVRTVIVVRATSASEAMLHAMEEAESGTAATMDQEFESDVPEYKAQVVCRTSKKADYFAEE